MIVRGIEGTKIFRTDEDRKTFLSRVGHLVESTHNRVLAWALLENHVHILLVSGPEGLSQFMRRLLTGYAVYYNGKYKRRGHLFQNRFKSIVCEEEPYLLELVRYIHLNPLRGGAVETLEDLDEYPWGGHSVLMGRRKMPWQEKEYVLSHFHKNRIRAVRIYRRFIGEGKNLGAKPELRGGGLVRSSGGWSTVMSMRGAETGTIGDARILGGGDFVSDILKEADEKLKRQLPSGRIKEIVDREINKQCEGEGVEESELRNGGQRRKASRVRAQIAYALSRGWGIPLAEIARNVGVSTSAVANAIAKFEKEKQK